MQDFKKALTDNTLVIGLDRTMKRIKQGDVKKVYVTSNCPEDTKGDVDHYAKLFSIPVVGLDENNEEFGALCKKPFSISIASIQ
jgi:ribosomal protein L30E